MMESANTLRSICRTIIMGKTYTSTLHFLKIVFNTYSMKQPDLYYFETIKMTSQA